MRPSAGLLVLVLACGNDHGVPVMHLGPDAPMMVDAGPDAGNPLEPPTLFGTGLCVDEACTQIGSGIFEYSPLDPQYVLFADLTAAKKRWIYLPPGTQIDTSDMNHWVFPLGTKIWKEFDIDGVRVETRYISKIADNEDMTPSPCFYVPYQWNSMLGGDTQGNMATAVTSGVTDANGTTHDIPSRSNCKSCHEDMVPGRVLGFSALSLDYPHAGSGSGSAAPLLNLDDVIALGWLSVAPPGASSPHYPLPADANGSDILALEYAHANCGECHNATSPVSQQVSINLRMDVTQLASTADTGLYKAIGVQGGPQTDASDPQGNCAPLAVGSDALAGCKDLVLANWAPAKMYNFDDRVVANGNAYLCTTKNAQVGLVFPCGTSGLTAPSGMGSAITDGTATWEYVGTPLQRALLIYRYETPNIGKHMPALGVNVMDPVFDPVGGSDFTSWVTSLE